MHGVAQKRISRIPACQRLALRPHKAASNRGLTMVLQLKQHLLELRQTQESLQEQTQLCTAQEEEIEAIQAECVCFSEYALIAHILFICSISICDYKHIAAVH